MSGRIIITKNNEKNLNIHTFVLILLKVYFYISLIQEDLDIFF